MAHLSCTSYLHFPLSMVLPANMSGAEKREKMAVMEAAISSSLSHPNIVQVRVLCGVKKRGWGSCR